MRRDQSIVDILLHSLLAEETQMSQMWEYSHPEQMKMILMPNWLINIDLISGIQELKIKLCHWMQVTLVLNVKDHKLRNMRMLDQLMRILQLDTWLEKQKDLTDISAEDSEDLEEDVEEDSEDLEEDSDWLKVNVHIKKL